jgi:diguanylate cyclase (GGDEF)-like protein/PAS domain S-box-containing protein
MSSANNPIHLLVLHDTQNDAEPLVNLFRNAGYATRSHFIASEDEMTDILSTQSWDLVLAKLSTDTVNVPHCVQQVSKLGKDIPIILLIDKYDSEQVEQGFRLGAKDVVVESENDHVIVASLRELDALQARRKLRDNEIYLRESEKRVQLLLQNSKDAIAYVHEGMHIYANQSYIDLFGYDDPDDLLSIPVMDLVEAEKLDELKKCLKIYNEGDTAKLECQVEHESGEKFPVAMDFSGATYDGEACIQIIIRKDEGNSAELERKIQEISNKDLLTGLYNRQHFIGVLDSAFQRAAKQNQNSIVLFVQLLEFVELRASVGIAGADIVLTDIAKLLNSKIKEGIVLARMGDDSFGMWIPTQDTDAIIKMSEALRKTLQDHLSEVNGRTVQVKASIGISLMDQKSASASEALTQAHQAADEASKSDSGIIYFDKNDIANIADDNVVARLRHALENDGFKILYQPIISLRGDAQEHYEVLLRMLDKEGNQISPAEFLSAAHASELAGDIDRWVVANTVKELAAHRQQGGNTQVVINLTPAAIIDPTFLPWVNTVLKESRLPGDAVVFQLSEDDALNYLKPAKAFSKGLSVLRSKLSISHFGRLENGLSLAKHLDIEYIKVHGDYVQDLESDEGQQKLEALIKAIQQHEIASIVPQIESASVLSQLWQAGANYIQGYLLQAPAAGMDYDFNEENDEEEAI